MRLKSGSLIWLSCFRKTQKRKKIVKTLIITHDSSMTEYLDDNKTSNRKLAHLYWPNARRDVAEDCRHYKTCQIIEVHNCFPVFSQYHYLADQFLFILQLHMVDAIFWSILRLSWNSKHEPSLPSLLGII
jgi:hypothetical protein